VSSRGSDRVEGRLLDGRYLIGSRIARGGMATVYAATDTRLDRLVAVKVMHPGLGDDDEVAARFVREARSAARLNHPGVVAVFDQGADDGTVFLVMEHVPGRTLREVVRDEAPLPPRRALALLEQVLTALAAAHAAGIVHRDVKPENVLLAPDGRVKVADFGLARAVTAATTTDTTVGSTGGPLIGTVAYLAPELVLDAGADARSDVYAAGVLLYELLTGVKPHGGETALQVAYQHVHADVPPPSQRVPSLPPYVDALVARATARDRDVRPTDAGVLLHQVRRVRSAVDQGLDDDPELTTDLRPHRTAAADGDSPYDWARDPADWPPRSAPHETDDPDDSTDTVVVASGGTTSRPPRLPARPARAALPDPAPRRWRRGAALVLALLVLAVLASGGWYVWVGRYTTTPPLVGLSQSEASGSADESGLAVSVRGEDYSETVPAGAVLRTVPDGEEPIQRGGTVELVLSAGPERHDVPRLVGLDVDTAVDRLAKLDLRRGELRRHYSRRFDEGTVVAQGTRPETSARPGTRVDVVVSLGPRPLDVPNHTGEPVKAAAADLRGLGFRVEVVDAMFDDAVPAGAVLTQTPASGPGFRGDVVELVVSKGPPLVEVPEVVGSGIEDARTLLEESGFVVEERTSVTYIGLGYVVAQEPAGASRAPAGSTIVLSLV